MKFFLHKLKKIVFLALIFVPTLLVSCKVQAKPIVLWTDKAEFVSYAELYNSLQDDIRMLVVYKENLADSLPPAKDELQPDIIAGSWLKNSVVSKNFSSLDHLFSQLQLNSKDFYEDLLEIGIYDTRLYLLPVSFNLPAIILSSKNRDLLEDEYMICIEEMRQKGSEYNKLKKPGLYTHMGFAPSWNQEFLYLALKLQNANFVEKDQTLSWDENSVNQTVAYLRDWTITSNTSSSAEDDFKFKYLFTPAYTLVSSLRCLFVSIRSDDFFNVNAEKLQNIDYRWLHQDGKIPIEDDMVSMGIYKKSKNKNLAENFVIWFMNEDNQKAMIERAVSMKLNTSTFGLAGGFSSLPKVNEKVFPLFYPMLLRNLPQEQNLAAPNILPLRWQSLKEKVVMPFVTEAINTDVKTPSKTLEELLAEWNKQYF